MCAHAKYITLGRTGNIVRVPMQNILLLTELKVVGVCPCRIYYFWQHWGHWACVHAEFITIGRTKGIGRVPMRIVSQGPRARGGGTRGGGTWGRRERRNGRCAHHGVATSSPAWPGRPYPVHPVESAAGTQTIDTRHLCCFNESKIMNCLLFCNFERKMCYFVPTPSG